MQSVHCLSRDHFATLGGIELLKRLLDCRIIALSLTPKAWVSCLLQHLHTFLVAGTLGIAVAYFLICLSLDKGKLPELQEACLYCNLSI